MHSGRGEAAETEAERGRRPADTRGIVDPAVRGIVGRVWPFAWSNETAAAALAWAWPAAVLVSWARWAMVTWSSQGRLIFSALPLWSLALALGLSVWVPRRFPVARRALPTALAVLLLGLSATALPAWILPAYRPPAPTTADAAALGMTPVDVAFGDTLALAGYRVETDATNPGGSVTLTLLWRALAPSAEDEAIFIHLLGQGERIVAQRDSFPGRGLVSTTQLQPGEAWTEDYVLAVPATAYAPDELALAVGVYSAATGARLAVSGGADAGAGIVVDADRVVFGQVALAPAAGGLALHAGEGMLLTGYGVSDLVVAPGATVTVTLDWQCTAPVDGDYTVSLQLIDANWNKVAQSDAWPQEGASPTSSWQVGQTIHESRALAIAPEAAPGVYDLRLTVYTMGPDGALVTAPLSLGGAEMPAKSIVLTGVRVR